MAKIGKLLGALSPLLLACALAFADDEPSITAVVQPNPVAIDDSLQFRIQVKSGNTERVNPPEFDAPGFTIVGQNSSRSVSMDIGSNGAQLRQNTIYTYVLFPRKDGVQKISNISVTVGEKKYPIQDIPVKIVGSAGSGGTGGLAQNEEDANPAAPGTFGAAAHPKKLNSDFTVHVALEKSKAYIGEPIVATYWIYASAPLREISIKRWPNFNGFWKEDLLIPSRYDWEQVITAGKLVSRSLVGRFALFGLNPGKIRLEQLLVTAKYVDARNAGGVDDPFFFPSLNARIRTGTHGSAPEEIEILPLPEAGQPQDYGGAVGQFKISFAHDKNEVTANSPLNFHFTVEGTGNFHAIEKIKIPFPPDFEIYDTKTNFQANAQIGATRSLANRKDFHYLVLPRKDGTFTIPEVRFSYFDPEKKTYRTFTTEPKKITVLADPNSGQGGNNTYATPGAEPLQAPQKKLELSYLKPDEKTKPILRWTFYTVLLANALLGLVFLMRRLPASGIQDWLAKSPRRRIALTVAKLERSAASRSEHYRALEASVLGLEEVLVGRSVAGMTQEERESAWREASLPAKLFMDLEQLLADAEQARYTGASTEQLSKDQVRANLDRLRELANTALKFSGKIS